MKTAETEMALATVEWLVQTIHVHSAAVCALQNVVHMLDCGPEDRGSAYEARDALLALRNAAAALIGDIEQDQDALTIGLTPKEAQCAFNEYAAGYLPSKKVI